MGDSGKYIWGEEGTTQGDPAAMPMYSLATQPLLHLLLDVLDDKTIQVWFADDNC